MITRDFLLRQIHQLIQVLTQVLLHKRKRQHVVAEMLLDEAFRTVTGLDLADIRRLDRDALPEALGLPDDPTSSEKAVALADLLREDAALCALRDDTEAASASRTRALWLYEAASSFGGLVPYDLAERTAALRDAPEA